MNKEYEIGKEIQMLSRKIKRKLDETFSDYGVTGVQVFILDFIHRESKKKKVYARDIEEEFDLRKATITGILNNLEQNEFIKRMTVGEDTRLKELMITDKALKLITKIEKKLEIFDKQLVCNLSEEEQSFFMKIINQILQNLS